jgi:hypothetical protein
VSDKDLFWFHCGRCGSLFQSKAGDLTERLCSKCGFDPSTGVMDVPQEAPVSIPAEKTHRSGSKSAKHGKHGGKKRKNRYFMLKLIAGWSLVLVLIVIGARRYFYKGDVNNAPAIVKEETESSLSQEEVAMLNDAGQKSTDVFSGYLSAITPEERNQFVLKPVSTASRMNRFYSLNPLAPIDPASATLTERHVLRLPGEKAIATLWTIQDGRSVEAIFRQENGEWRLDWDHFARYSDYPWPLFLAGSGEPEGEFRLLARERLAEMRKDQETISLVLYAPRFGQSKEAGIQSPEFLVQRSSKDGVRLAAAFKLAREGKRIYDSKLPETNPDGMIRVRVKVKRTEVELQRSFEITAVKACHWYAIDDPGVSEEKAAEK